MTGEGPGPPTILTISVLEFEAGPFFLFHFSLWLVASTPVLKNQPIPLQPMPARPAGGLGLLCTHLSLSLSPRQRRRKLFTNAALVTFEKLKK